MKKKKDKIKVIYKEDTGETIYSMAGLYGKTPEEVEQAAEKHKQKIKLSRKERRAMISAAFQVYGLPFLLGILAFSAVAVALYLWLR